MMIISLPLISVIIPVYNGERFLTEALDSVHSQNYQSLEIILVDDGSTDKTASIARSNPKVSYIYQHNQGAAAAKNTGIKAAKGEYITFLDSDDLYPPGMLLNLATYLSQNTTVDIVHGLVQQLNYNPQTETFDYSGIPHWNVNFASALYRKSVFEKIGYFDISLKTNEDVDWFMRAWELGIPKDRIYEVTLLRRRHDQNMTNDKLRVQQGLVQAFYRHLKRTRQESEVLPSSITVADYFGYVSSPELPKIS
ncbi:glycosyltransferase family A protein [Thermosynechococcaceae cyanobacterium BACA0444]|uniref:Glycosyltransferase family A protein n=1 Tax=Pseudocalidococcus azoricus BACA0444 TaxID=2918990 RepID=A0AAE4FSU4_9CYAN|nr:glycosyltransferase family A protein [Pseudocalidococcus azoricus]MDS3861158.1 glycosyltransferase family A protein [Pseudocalidococcus azoricus BACA0444]